MHMASSKRQLLWPSIFEAVRRDAVLTAESETTVAMRPEFVWAAQILTRVSCEQRIAGFSQRYLAAVSTMSVVQGGSEPPDETRREFENLLSALRGPRSRAAATELARATAHLIDSAEASGCTSICDSLAAAALPLCQNAHPPAYGEVLWRAARARRKIGDLDTADRHYAVVLAIGRRHKNHTLIARGAIGLGILARELGNIERVIRLFEEAHEHAQLSKSRELQILAHQGMQISAGVVGDHAGELRHVWLAYSLSIGDPVHEYEALHNVAWYACAAGIANEALPALQWVLAQAPLKPLLKFHYLGTTATAAAQCDRRDVVNEIRAELDRFKNSAVHPHEYGLALISLGEAFDWLGEKSLARQYRESVRSLARRFGLHELMQRLQSPMVRASVGYPIDDEVTAEIEEVRRVLRTIASGVLGSGSDRGQGAIPDRSALA